MSCRTHQSRILYKRNIFCICIVHNSYLMQDFSFEDEFALRVLFSAGYRNNIALAFETSVMTMQFFTWFTRNECNKGSTSHGWRETLGWLTIIGIWKNIVYPIYYNDIVYRVIFFYFKWGVPNMLTISCIRTHRFPTMTYVFIT